MKQIPLFGGKFVLVDDEDYPYLSRFNWKCTSDNHVVKQFSNKNGIVMEIPMTDFIKKRPRRGRVVYNNGNTLDLRKENIIMSSLSFRVHRFKKSHGNYTSKYKGVSLDRNTEKFRDGIMSNGKLYRLGRYESEEAAALAYNKKARELYGELAYQNEL